MRKGRYIKRVDEIVAPIEATVLELPNSRVARACASVAYQFGISVRRVSYWLYHKSLTARAGAVGALRYVLLHRSLAVFVAILGIALTLPILWRDWGWSDDMLQRSVLLSATLPKALTDLFVFLDPAKNAQLMDLGVLPWWTLETVHTAFFRPLAALTQWLDYQLWPNSAALMHAHSILWYGGVCALVALCYRRFIGRSVMAGLAAFLFAADIGHVSCIASLAGRNALLALFFGLLALMAHDRWRQQGWRVGGWLALVCLALSLLSAEAGIATCAYLFAYAVYLDRDSWRRRIGSLIPYGAVVVVWRAVYQALGYGAWGSGFYIDPGREPLRFAAGILERGPVLLLGQWGIPEPGVYALLSMWVSRAYWLIALLLIVLLGVVLGPLLRKDRRARFWGLGMMLSVVPACAISFPSGRLLIFVGLGAIGLMAQFIVGLFKRSAWLPVRRLWRIPAWIVCAFLLWFHAILSPILLSASQTMLDSFFHAITDIGPLPEAERQDVVIVNAPCPGNFIYVPSLRASRGQPMPAHLRILAPGYYEVEVIRIDERTLVVRPEHGYLVQPGAIVRGDRDLFPLAHPAYGYQHGDGFFRGDAFPMTLGERVELTGMSVEVTALTEDGRPLEARMTFTAPLEDGAFHWLQWDWEQNAYLPFEVPAVGETVHIAGPSSMWSPVLEDLRGRVRAYAD